MSHTSRANVVRRPYAVRLRSPCRETVSSRGWRREERMNESHPSQPQEGQGSRVATEDPTSWGRWERVGWQRAWGGGGGENEENRSRIARETRLLLARRLPPPHVLCLLAACFLSLVSFPSIHTLTSLLAVRPLEHGRRGIVRLLACLALAAGGRVGTTAGRLLLLGLLGRVDTVASRSGRLGSTLRRLGSLGSLASCLGLGVVNVTASRSCLRTSRPLRRLAPAINGRTGRKLGLVQLAVGMAGL